jgi:cytoskeleton protein RodZ
MPLFGRMRKVPGDSIPAADGDEPGQTPRGTIGDLLRETRQSYGGEIERIAAQLRIRGPYLAAIEAGRYDRLPAPVYALGFVRAYAVHLGLDGEEAVRRFKQETSGFAVTRDLAFPVPLAQRSIPGGTVVLAALILAICGYGLWYYLSTGDRWRPERVSSVPTELAAPGLVTPAAPPAANSAPPAADLGPKSPAEETRDTAPAAEPASAVPAAAPASVAAAPIAAAAAPVVSTAPGPVSIPASGLGAAAATAPALADGAHTPPVGAPIQSMASWVQIHDADQSPILTRTLHAGDQVRVPDKPGLTLRTGNGSALAITVDGAQAPSLGGTIRRNVALDPDRLRAGTALTE